MEKIELGFDEAFLEDQLNRTYKSFEAFAQGVREKIDESVFSEDSLSRMYAVNEKLREYVEQLSKIHTLKEQANAADEVQLKRYEAQEHYVETQVKRTSSRLEELRRGTAPGEAQQGESFLKALMTSLPGAMAKSVLATGGNIGEAVTGFQIGEVAEGVVEGAHGIRKYFQGEVNPDTNRRERNKEVLKEAVKAIGIPIVGALGTLALSGYKQMEEEEESQKHIFQHGGLKDPAFQDWMRRNTDMQYGRDLISRYGKSRHEILPTLEALSGATGSMAGWEKIMGLQEAYGLGGAGVNLARTATQTGNLQPGDQAGLEAMLARAVGSGTLAGMKSARFGEIFESMGEYLKVGVMGAKPDLAWFAKVQADTGREFGQEYAGRTAGAAATEFARVGVDRGKDFGLMYAMAGKEEGGLGLDFIQALKRSEKGFNSPAFRKYVNNFFGQFEDDVGDLMMKEMLGFSSYVNQGIVKRVNENEALGRGKFDQAIQNVGNLALKRDEETSRVFNQMGLFERQVHEFGRSILGSQIAKISSYFGMKLSTVPTPEHGLVFPHGDGTGHEKTRHLMTPEEFQLTDVYNEGIFAPGNVDKGVTIPTGGGTHGEDTETTHGVLPESDRVNLEIPTLKSSEPTKKTWGLRGLTVEAGSEDEGTEIHAKVTAKKIKTAEARAQEHIEHQDLSDEEGETVAATSRGAK